MAAGRGFYAADAQPNPFRARAPRSPRWVALHLLQQSRMSATSTFALPLESHDTPRKTPSKREDAVPETTREAEPACVDLDNPYDNIACTD
jgi:hypothetical protein